MADTRFFTPAQRRKLFIRADGKCEECGCPLGDGWEAHHIKRWADGGETHLFNAAALCWGCHQSIHRGTQMSITPRGWQKDALAEFENRIARQSKHTLISCTPGGGKTIFSALCLKAARKEFPDIKVIVVVPTTSLKYGFKTGYFEAGLELTPAIKPDRHMAPTEYDGGVVTYAQLKHLVNTFEQWVRGGEKIMFVFDEIHHASEKNVWGEAAEACARIGQIVLSMTGTPFRGDGRKISFVNYDSSGTAIPDFSYGYREAVADTVCRPLFFEHDDANADWREPYIGRRRIVVSQCRDEDVGKAQAAVFSPKSDWIANVISKASNKLDEYRQTDPDAGGLIICRPGSDEKESRHLHAVADTLESIVGEKPTVISHDDQDADEKIERFKHGLDRWIVSVRKISEGVDIKRLRVLVMASAPGTELLFRQIVGRVVRVEHPLAREDSTVYIAKFPRLMEWATRIADEAQAGLAQKKENERGDGDGEPTDEPREKPSFELINVEHVNGGGIAHHGSSYTHEEIRRAEQAKRGNPKLAEAPIDMILEAWRIQNSASEDETPEVPKVEANVPLHDRKMTLWKEIDRKRRRLAILQHSGEDGGPAGEDFQRLASWLSRRVGFANRNDLLDNHGIEKMEEAIEVLNAELKKWSGAA